MVDFKKGYWNLDELYLTNVHDDNPSNRYYQHCDVQYVYDKIIQRINWMEKALLDNDKYKNKERFEERDELLNELKKFVIKKFGFEEE